MGVSLPSIAVVVLLTFGVGVELACCLGVLVMGDAHDKLHYIGPAAIFGPLAVALAIVIRESLSQAGIKALLTAGLLIIVNPVLTHAIGRALYIRRRDHLEPEPRNGGLRR
jgi:multicomponent Na+:H+ antiporter subunit G